MPPRKKTSSADEPLAKLRQQLLSESTDSLKLIENPADNSICCAGFDPSLPGIVITTRQYATSNQLRFICEHALSLLKQHAAHKILGDFTPLPTIDPDDQTWIAQDWMPRAAAAGLSAIASKKPESYFGQLSMTNLRARAPKEIKTRSFTTLQQARRWLQKLR